MSVHTESGSYRYHAYLSYSHRDEKWAKWLHRKLEAYRTPRHLVGRKTATGIIPKRIAPIFRDRDELPTAVDLGETVTKALRDSKNLIVICSPHAATSRWVNEEILTFKRQGRAEGVFCFIVAGEPSVAMGAESTADDCFPAALRFQLGEDGNLTDQLSEPVAADARKRKDGKLDAKLKLIAGLIGVGFDELKRRELHHRHYRMVAVTATALAVMVVTSVLAWRAIVAEQEALENRAKAEDLISFILGDLRERLAPIGRLEDLNVVGD
ncbi:MAG: toll/interleukin-1 receptor domain-containing protein, partial [Woeseiaceae bacterium]